jgi:hypothetical protein
MPEYACKSEESNNTSLSQCPLRERLAGEVNDRYAANVESAEQAIASDPPLSHQRPPRLDFRSVCTKVALILSSLFKGQHSQSPVEPIEAENMIKFVNSKFQCGDYMRFQTWNTGIEY